MSVGGEWEESEWGRVRGRVGRDCGGRGESGGRECGREWRG